MTVRPTRCGIIPPYLLERLQGARRRHRGAVCPTRRWSWDRDQRAARVARVERANGPAGLRPDAPTESPTERPAEPATEPATTTPGRSGRSATQRARRRLPGSDGADEGGPATQRRGGRRGVRRARGDLGAVLVGVRPQQPRRRRAAVAGERALRAGLRQRVLERHPDGVRRRRRDVLQPVHDRRRRHRARADPRGHRADGRAGLQQPVRGAQREHVRLLRLDGQAAAARPGRRRRPTG